MWFYCGDVGDQDGGHNYNPIIILVIPKSLPSTGVVVGGNESTNGDAIDEPTCTHHFDISEYSSRRCDRRHKNGIVFKINIASKRILSVIGIINKKHNVFMSALRDRGSSLPNTTNQDRKFQQILDHSTSSSNCNSKRRPLGGGEGYDTNGGYGGGYGGYDYGGVLDFHLIHHSLNQLYQSFN